MLYPRVDRGVTVTFPDVIGLIGVALYVGAYASLQLGILGLSDLRYSILNAVGGIAVIYSLIWNFNLAAFVTQVLWLAFTVIGFVRSRRTQATSSPPCTARASPEPRKEPG
jgi:hypothetical protein